MPFGIPGRRKGFPYLTGQELETMLLYQPRYRNPERMTKPDNLAEAEAIAPGLTPVYPDSADLVLDVDTPSRDRMAIGDPRLIDLLARRDWRSARTDLATIKPGDDGLSAGLSVFDPHGSATWRGIGNQLGQAPLPREHLP